MAIVQYTGAVNQIRGKLNGSVFNKSRNAFTLQRKQQPKKSLTTAQAEKRSQFGSVQRRWQNLSPIERETAQASAFNNPTRDRFGNEVVLSGYNHWVKNNIIRLQIDEAVLGQMQVTPATPVNYEMESFSLEFEVNLQGLLNVLVIADVTPTVTNNQHVAFLCYISKPVSRGITNYTGRWYSVAWNIYGAGSFEPPSQEFYFQSEAGINYPLPQPGQQIFVKIDAWQYDRGAKINTKIFSHIEQ